MASHQHRSTVIRLVVGVLWLAVINGCALAASGEQADPPLAVPDAAEAALIATRTHAPTLTASLTPLPSRTLTASPTVTPSRTRTTTPTPTLTPTRRPSRAPSLSPTPLPSFLPAPLPGDVTIIGYSLEGRPIEVYRFGNGPIERMIVAGMHGGYEWNTIALAGQLIVYLTDHPEVIPPDVTLFILRSLNPDGEARSRAVSGRANANGVDLNRNWPALWQAAWPRDGCWQYLRLTAGIGPASEPETLALMNFLLTHRVEALVNYHSAAQGIFPGGQPPDPASLSLAEAVAAVSDYPYPPLDFGCQFTGQLIDWASEHGIAALDVELTNHRDTDFEQNLSILSVLLAWER